jgi:predicted transcriptional regulator of viral defense system
METKTSISFLEFRDIFFPLGCFSLNQIRIWKKDFNRNNLGRWEKEGKLLRLRQGMYTFPQYKDNADTPFFFANKIYSPSYVSLQSALSFYGIIPEGVVQTTSITSLKTATFRNAFGEFSYRSVKPELMFGWHLEKSNLQKDWSLMIAFPEKALLDLLYLYPQYKTPNDMQELRFDTDFMQEELNLPRFENYLSRFNSKALEKRVSLLKGVYL